jgi:hypothetical protein
MPKSFNQEKLNALRSEFPFFIYENYSYSMDSQELKMQFHFNLADRYHFFPSLSFPCLGLAGGRETDAMLSQLVFHIGMVELLSYWKAACPARVIIKPAGLLPAQVQWWMQLYYQGLGEFIYLNTLNLTMDSLMTMESSGARLERFTANSDADSVIIPVGGGKDSAVTLEILRREMKVLPLGLNTGKAMSEVIAAAGFSEESSFLVNRVLDPLLLELNSKGFLNGHTPFSALLGFISLAAAAVTGTRYIALSNESSANEPTIPGTSVNHQYSKSLEFEMGFRRYVNTYITPDIEYFSFLRPLSELQIARLFSGMKSYHKVFRSCNAGSKTGKWCGECAKCLFTFIILSPFTGIKGAEAVFGRNLLDDPALAGIMHQLTGAAEEKPFDCIGTVNEVNLALCEIIRREGDRELPFLLRRYRDSKQFGASCNLSFGDSLEHYMPNCLPARFEIILKKALYG